MRAYTYGESDPILQCIHRLAKDQTEINRIIAEASKGSKFYDVSIHAPWF